MSGRAQASPLVTILRAALERFDADDWVVGLEDIWCSARPGRYAMPGQGWKLHLAASRSSAAAVLERAIPALVSQRCAFKFASTHEDTALINSAHYPLGESGKFLTAYPLDVDHFRRVADDLPLASSTTATARSSAEAGSQTTVSTSRGFGLPQAAGSRTAAGRASPLRPASRCRSPRRAPPGSKPAQGPDRRRCC